MPRKTRRPAGASRSCLTGATTLAQKQQLVAQLASDPGPNEREEIQRLLAKIETALTLLEPNDALSRGE